MRKTTAVLSLLSFMLLSCAAPAVSSSESESSASFSSVTTSEDDLSDHIDRDAIVSRIDGLSSFTLTADIEFEVLSEVNVNPSDASRTISSITLTSGYSGIRMDGQNYESLTGSHILQRCSLSEYAKATGKTIEQIKRTFAPYAIDEENDSLIVDSMDTVYNTLIAYDEEADQYYSFYSSGEVYTGQGRYLTSLSIFFSIDSLKEDLKAFVRSSEFDADKGAFVLPNAGVSASWVNFLPMDHCDGATLFIENDYPSRIEYAISKDFIHSTYRVDLDSILTYSLSMSFSEFNEVSILSPDKPYECEHHVCRSAYAKVGEGHRMYCTQCQKFLSEYEGHIVDEEYGRCVKCGNIDTTLHVDKDSLVQENGDEKLYAFSIQENDKGKVIYVNLFVNVDSSDTPYSSARDLNYAQEYYDQRYCELYYHPKSKALVTCVDLPGEKRLREDYCVYVREKRYSLYKSVDLVYDADRERLYASSGESAMTYVDTLTPVKTLIQPDFYSSHSDYQTVYETIDGVHTAERVYCGHCHECIQARIIEGPTTPPSFFDGRIP